MRKGVEHFLLEEGYWLILDGRKEYRRNISIKCLTLDRSSPALGAPKSVSSQFIRLVATQLLGNKMRDKAVR